MVAGTAAIVHPGAGSFSRATAECSSSAGRLREQPQERSRRRNCQFRCHCAVRLHPLAGIRNLPKSCFMGSIRLPRQLGARLQISAAGYF